VLYAVKPHSLVLAFRKADPTWRVGVVITQDGGQYWAHNSAALHMVRSEEHAIVRRAFAEQVLASVSVQDQRSEEAFAGAERERYLGPGPWPILRSAGYVFTPNADPVYLYCDVLIGIVPERGLNNGMPSYHAPLIASLVLREGEHVVHVGAGTGYYTAIMAHLVGSIGRVTAIEFDSALVAAREAKLLRNRKHPCAGGRRRPTAVRSG
jgi:Protein-L-isoaspartate(D-aspartate) O-methyltransferase (PCMT)